ncbi:alpha/beta fold hydrolase [Paludibaculum fermentans]|uniref:Alpha/beta fold hydrolase n=1 Tax=Paludibaculum fermentans TaxID=1473598 RepID=A0A7S7NNY0_PALFE|nr:alpha/beta fold hydrolase [Paludibaculum fermentans]QOY87030.1 alpha/beta fold hydrolase [Paludibaculum fermentans]
MLLPILALLMVSPPAETEHLPSAAGFVTIWRTHALSGSAHAGIERAFLLVHGAGRNAEDYYRWALASAMAAGEIEKTIVIAPHFKSRAGGDPVEAGELEWSGGGWASGELSIAGKTTSYDVIDLVLEILNSSERFPDLKEVVVAGHSAGGQFVQRYAAVNRMEARMRVPVRYVAANPSSYLYLNELRMQLGATCSENGRCTGKFVKYWDAANCTTYNQYRYGMEKRTGYAAGTSEENILELYPRRKVTYIVGALDTRTDDSSLDRSCRAIAQGPNRKERGLIFYNYMKTQFNAVHTLEIAPGCGHSAVCVFAGPAGVKAVFGK